MKKTFLLLLTTVLRSMASAFAQSGKINRYDIIKGDYTLKLKVLDKDGDPFEKSYPVKYDYNNDYDNMWFQAFCSGQTKQILTLKFYIQIALLPLW